MIVSYFADKYKLGRFVKKYLGPKDTEYLYIFIAKLPKI